MLSCLTKRAWLMGWTLLLLVMTCYFFFPLFITSEWTRQHSVTARLSTLDQTFSVLRTNVVISFQVRHLKAYFSLLLSSPHQICPSSFLKRWHRPWGGGIWLLYSLAMLPFSWDASLESAVMLVLGCGFQQNWNGCFPSGSEQLSETMNASIQQQEPVFCCACLFVLCTCNFWTSSVLGS